jgi:hypothetical protein
VNEETIPVLKASDARTTAAWFHRLGFETEWEHQFGPTFPIMISMARSGAPGARIFISEHEGDAKPFGLFYLRVANVDAVAAEFEAEVLHAGWAREVHLEDPDGNRVRVGTPTPESTPEHEFTTP